jgi:preprotein translocase subunit YajC
MTLLSILLQAPAAGGASSYSGILMMVLIFVVFYFFMIRPQSKRQKEIKKQREAMKAGDKVVTSGGIYGRVKEIKDTTVTVEIAENVRIKIDKNSVFATVEDIQSPAK